MTTTSSSIQETVVQENSVVNQLNVLEQLSKPEIQESLSALIENLPKITEMMTALTKAYEFSQTVLSDKVLIEDFAGGLREFVKPIEGTVKEYAAVAIEASERSRSDRSTYNVFSLMGMLKDPQLQKAFRFVRAFLDITGERAKNK